jgi:hypothetical protein
VRAEDDQSALAQHQRPDQGFEHVGGIRDALWRPSDPLPYLVQQLRRVQRALQHRAARMMPRSQTNGGKA